MLVNKIATKVATHINSSPKLQKLFIGVSENPSKHTMRFSSIVNGVLRPITNLVTIPKENFMDGVYGASSAISSSIVELITGSSIIKGVKKSINKSATQLQECGFFDSMSDSFSESTDALSHKYKSICNRFTKIGTVPINTVLKYVIIVPIAGFINKGIDKIFRKNISEVPQPKPQNINEFKNFMIKVRGKKNG